MKEKKKFPEWLTIGDPWKKLIVDTNVTFMEIMAVIVTSTLLGLMVFGLLSEPGGLPGVLAGVMIEACSKTGNCDFQMLLASLGLGMVLLTSFSIYTMRIIKQGVDKIGSAPEKKSPNGKYSGRQLEVLQKIQGMGEVDSLLAWGIYLGVPYGTLHRWVREFEQDGLVRITSNGSGSPLKVEAL